MTLNQRAFDGINIQPGTVADNPFATGLRPRPVAAANISNRAQGLMARIEYRSIRLSAHQSLLSSSWTWSGIRYDSPASSYVEIASSVDRS